jgi:hypothetical protein
VLLQVLGGSYQEAACSRRRITDDFPGLRSGERDHQLNDVGRRAELSVLPGGGDLRELVLVHVALGISVIHVDAVDQQDGLREQSARGMVKRASRMCRA